MIQAKLDAKKANQPSPDHVMLSARSKAPSTPANDPIQLTRVAPTGSKAFLTHPSRREAMKWAKPRFATFAVLVKARSGTAGKVRPQSVPVDQAFRVRPSLDLGPWRGPQ